MKHEVKKSLKMNVLTSHDTNNNLHPRTLTFTATTTHTPLPLPTATTARQVAALIYSNNWGVFQNAV